LSAIADVGERSNRGHGHDWRRCPWATLATD
jgi:hypothetical protein